MNLDACVITGIGVIAPNAIGKDEYWRGCFEGRSGIRSISLFDASKFRCHLAGEVSALDPEKYLGAKGLRNLDRTTLFALMASKLALEDSGLQLTEALAEDAGVVLGTTMGSLRSISDFDQEALRHGPRYVNPGVVPNTVINSPASQVGIRFGLQGLNTTVAAGFGSSLEAIGYAQDMLRFKRVRYVLVGGVEELCLQTFLGFYNLGILAGSQAGETEVQRPCDQDANGFILGEGAGVVLLELHESAVERGAHIYCEIAGMGSAFNLGTSQSGLEGAAFINSMEQALQAGHGQVEQTQFICVSANGDPLVDDREGSAIKYLFQDHPVAVSNIKGLIGESFSASGALGLIAGIGVIERQTAFAMHGLRQPSDAWKQLDVVRTSNRAMDVHGILVNAFGQVGSNSSVYLKRYESG